MKNWKLSALLNTPLGVVIVVGTIALVVELLFMALLHEFLMVQFKFSDTAWDFIDAITLTATISPALYFLVFRKMRESEERFRQILATAPNAIVMVDGQGRITDWNHTAQRIFQYSQEEAVGQQMHQLIAPPRYHDDAARGFARFEETGEGPLIGKITEIAATRKDGSEFPAELSISAVKLKGRWHAIGIIHDITERKRTEEALRDSEDKFRNIVERSFDAIHMLDMEGRFTYCSPRVELISGYRPDEVIGIHFKDFLFEEDIPKAYSAFNEMIGGGAVKGLVLKAKKKDGTLLFLEINGAPIFKGEKITGIQFVYRDITERKRAEDTLRESEERFHHLFENMSNGVAIYQPDAACEVFTFKSLNRALERIERVKREEVLGRSLEDVFPGVRAFGLLEVLQRVCRSGEAEHFPPAFYQDGRIAGWRENYVYRLDSGEIVAVYDDVTERKHQEERTAALLELSSSTESLDEKTLLQRGLDTVQQLTGSRIGFLHFVSEDQNEIELVTWSTDTLAHYCQADFDRHYPVPNAGIWADCIRLKQPIIINDYATAPGKKGYPERHADVQRFVSVPVFEGTQVRMIVGVGNAASDYDEHDVETVKLFSYDLYRIVQRKRMDEELQLTYFALNHAVDSVFFMEPSGKFRYANETACRVLGYSKEELLSMSVADIDPNLPEGVPLEMSQATKKAGVGRVE